MLLKRIRIECRVGIVLVKDYIKYEEKEYQISTVLLYDCEFETMIFPVKNGIVSGSEVYKFTTFDAGESQRKHRDVLYNAENYVSKEAIKKYLKEKEELYDRCL